MGLFKKKEKFFFNAEEETLIINAIRDAEDQSSGEIRVHVEPSCKGDTFERALALFAELEMHRTQLHNGVLFYLAYDEHKFSIVADQGINKVVPENFWEDIKNMMEAKFKKGEFISGLQQGIALAGEQLQKYFPQQGGTDKNELTDEVSQG
jgi:uncharacterized membrane protein